MHWDIGYLNALSSETDRIGDDGVKRSHVDVDVSLIYRALAHRNVSWKGLNAGSVV
jgi:hypothetical protein